MRVSCCLSGTNIAGFVDHLTVKLANSWQPARSIVGKRTSAVGATQVFVDKGYRSHNCNSDTCKVYISGAKRGITPSLRRKLKRRNAIEPVIGHMKSDTRLSRNLLKGVHGDAINALLCAAGHNLRKILAKLRLFCARWGIGWYELLSAVRAQQAIV
jgi:transposase, IS5 family